MSSSKVTDYLRALAQVRSPRKIYFYSIVIGLISGLLALVFNWALHSVEIFTFFSVSDVAGVAGHHSEINISQGPTTSSGKVWLFFLPTIGALISGLIVQYISPESKGPGTDAMIQSFHEKNAHVKLKTPFAKAIATLASLGTGGSGGKEGPISQIGAAFGSLIGRALGVGPRARRTLYLAGMAGALGAIFRAPLGAALASVEILYKEDFESDALIPCILSSITGYFVFTSVYGFAHIFQTPQYLFHNWIELISYTVLGLLCFAAGFAFVKIYNTIETYFEKIPIPLFMRVMLGGLLVGCIGLLSYESLGGGFAFVQAILHEPEIVSSSGLAKIFFSDSGVQPAYLVILFLLCTALLKMLTTSLTIATGGSGGVFGPSVFIGALLGAAIGIGMRAVFPDMVISHAPYVIVGMAGFFAGVANAPIASVIMVTELTGSYELLAPLLLVSIVALVFSHRFGIYKQQRLNRFHSPAHEWDMTKDFLKGISIHSAGEVVMKSHILSINAKASTLFKAVDKYQETDFIIRTSENKYVGILSLRTMTASQIDEMRKSDLINEAAILSDIPSMTSENSLSRALDLLINYNTLKIAITDSKENLLGHIDMKSIFKIYRKKVLKG